MLGMLRHIFRLVRRELTSRVVLFVGAFVLIYFAISIGYGILNQQSLISSVKLSVSAIFGLSGSTSVALDIKNIFLYLAWFVGGALIASVYVVCSHVLNSITHDFEHEIMRDLEYYAAVSPASLEIKAARISQALARRLEWWAATLDAWPVRLAVQVLFFVATSIGAAVTTGQSKDLGVFILGGTGIGFLATFAVKAGLIGLGLKTVYTATLGYCVTKFLKWLDKRREQADK